MNYYIEITLLPGLDFGLFKLWSCVFEQLHLGFVENQDDQKRVPIGLSFPEYRMGNKYGVLGSKCRLFARDEAALESFDAAKRLARLSDYVHCTGVRPVPAKIAGHAVYRRLQPKTNPERLARRYAKRHGIGFDEALQRYESMAPVSVRTPFIRLKSSSSDESFCLWIDKVGMAEVLAGSFSCYGLSATGTVPEF